MPLELLTQADYVLNACGRPVPPKGYKFVDLPKIIPFHSTVTAHVEVWQWEDEAENGMVLTAIQPLPNYTVVTNVAAVPWSIVISGLTITINVPDDNSITLGDGLALLNGDPAFSAIYVATALPGSDPNVAWGAGDNFGLTTILGGFNNPFPMQERIENISNTLFIVKAIVLSSDPVSVRIKWPTGRYWNQFPSNNPNASLGAGANFPQGTGGNSYALDEEVPIEKGGKVAVELSGPNAAPVDIQLWGVLRYLLKETGGPLAAVDGETCIIGYPANAQSQGKPNCLIGYPVSAGAKGKAGSFMMRDPIEELKERTRFVCWPNGNIFAPEFRLGNQCETFTPAGFDDEAFTYFSDPIVVPAGGQSYSNSVIVPGQDDIVIRRWRAIITWSDGGHGNPVIGMRSPSGYSVTGGDQVPVFLFWWAPMFPTLIVKHGTEIILDVSMPGGSGTATVVIEFDAAKRRRMQ